MKKIYNFTTDKDEISELLYNLRWTNKKIVFTNGCFDLTHSIHINLLNESKKIGDVLITENGCEILSSLLKSNEVSLLKI